MFSIRPSPKTDKGMRKIRSLSAAAVAKLGWGMLQPGAGTSLRPEMTNRSSTPPFGAAVLAVPLALKKNGKRASRVGPLAVMKEGMVLVEEGAITMPPCCGSLNTRLCGLAPIFWPRVALGLPPPVDGCEWHPEH